VIDSPICLPSENKALTKAEPKSKSPTKLKSLVKNPKLLQETPPNNVVTSSQMPGKPKVSIDAYFKLNIDSIQKQTDSNKASSNCIKSLSKSATKFNPPDSILPLLTETGLQQQRTIKKSEPFEIDPKRCCKCQQFYDESRMTKNAPNRRITDSCGHSICFACFIRSHTLKTGVCGTCGDCPICKRTCSECNQENYNLEESMNFLNEENDVKLNTERNNNTQNASDCSMKDTIIDETVLESESNYPQHKVVKNQSDQVYL